MLLRNLPSLGAFFLKASILFFLLLPPWLAVSPSYTRLVVRVTSAILGLTTPSADNSAQRIILRVERDTIVLTNPSESSQHFLSGIQAAWMHGNFLILAALFLADSRHRLRHRLKCLGRACSILFGWHLVYVFFLVKLFSPWDVLHGSRQEVKMVQAAAGSHLSQVFLQILAPQFVPFILWATFSPPLAQEEKAGRVPQKRVSRNSPCPCGSGKKYKRCCGR